MSETRFTPGPWSWFGNAKTNDIHLATTHSGRLYVMGFERWGMQNAQPTFRESHRMARAKDLVCFSVGDGSARGIDEAREDDGVYRYDIKYIDNPDAHLIAASPELYEALAELILARFDETDEPFPELTNAFKALAKARGEKT